MLTLGGWFWAIFILGILFGGGWYWVKPEGPPWRPSVFGVWVLVLVGILGYAAFHGPVK